MQIAVAGLGAMGSAIAERLIALGHRVTVWNRTAAKAAPLTAAGAALAQDPAAAAAATETIITILTDAAAIEAVYHGPRGLLSGAAAGKLFVDMSTVAPEVETALAAKVRSQGAAFVECPVGGSTTPARTGQLLGLMGAAPADAARARPLLEQLCRKVEHCGAVGAGSAMKLAINLPLMVAWQAYGEAFAIARDVGFPPQRLLDLFVESNGANNGLKMRADKIVAMMEDRDSGPATFSIANAVKDLKTMLEAGTAQGVDLPATRATLAALEEASRAGLGSGDAARQAVYWSRRVKD